MQVCQVKWFDNKKGYGFARTKGLDEDIIVHHSEIIMDGFKTLRQGQSVECELEQTLMGFKAKNVKPL